MEMTLTCQKCGRKFKWISTLEPDDLPPLLCPACMRETEQY